MSQDFDKNGSRFLDGERLHRYHDGELSAPERAQVEAALDETARARLAALDDLGALLRATSEAGVAEAPAFDAWGAVRKEMAASRVTSIDSARKRRRAIWAGVSSLAVAAAAMFLVVSSPFSRAEAAVNGVEVEEVEASGASLSVMETEADGQGKLTVVWLNEIAPTE